MLDRQVEPDAEPAQDEMRDAVQRAVAGDRERDLVSRSTCGRPLDRDNAAEAGSVAAHAALEAIVPEPTTTSSS